MSKKKDEVEKVAPKEKVIHMVEMEKGLNINFGARYQMIYTIAINPTGYIIDFCLRSGKVFTYIYDNGVNISPFLSNSSAIGLVDRVKSSLAGCKDMDAVNTMVAAKVKEFELGIFKLKASGVPKISLTLDQQAYGMINSMDINAPGPCQEIKDHFESLSKEEKTAFHVLATTKVALSEIKLAAAKATYEAALAEAA